jgi:hypothetical protein
MANRGVLDAAPDGESYMYMLHAEYFKKNLVRLEKSIFFYLFWAGFV